MLKQVGARVWQADEPDARKACEAGSLAWRPIGIRAVLCPAFNVRIPYHPELAAMLLPVRDETDVPAGMYDLAVDFHRRLGPTLVHCFGGLNRSSVFAAALLMADGLPLEDALERVNALPRPEILASLRRWAQGGGS